MSSLLLWGLMQLLLVSFACHFLTNFDQCQMAHQIFCPCDLIHLTTDPNLCFEFSVRNWRNIYNKDANIPIWCLKIQVVIWLCSTVQEELLIQLWMTYHVRKQPQKGVSRVKRRWRKQNGLKEERSRRWGKKGEAFIDCGSVSQRAKVAKGSSPGHAVHSPCQVCQSCNASSSGLGGIQRDKGWAEWVPRGRTSCPTDASSHGSDFKSKTKIYRPHACVA